MNVLVHHPSISIWDDIWWNLILSKRQGGEAIANLHVMQLLHPERLSLKTCSKTARYFMRNWWLVGKSLFMVLRSSGMTKMQCWFRQNHSHVNQGVI